MNAKTLMHLSANARTLAADSLIWSDQFWDPEVNLLVLDPPDAEIQKPNVRNSSWYALGLLMRDDGDDRQRAIRTIDAVLDTQFYEPGSPYHGTFPRWVGEPHPLEDAIIWRDYDPNWRQFIGSTWALILDEYSQRLPADLIQRMDRSVQLAVLGEPPDRCPPAYTNIALMKAGLLTWAGDRFDRSEWTTYGEEFGQAVFDLFKEQSAFYEYNSPTYYGTDFFALAFWKNYARSSMLSRMGREMEATLWRDVAQYYHAGLRNVCGPYSRSYGMNMADYGALLGLAIWTAVGRTEAPFPNRSGLFDHSHDYCYGPPLALVGVEVPEDVISDLMEFSGERLVRHRIAAKPDRVATAWLTDSLMIGAESVHFDAATRRAYRPLGDQYHPVTMHWRCPNGAIGWLRLRHEGPVDARIEPGRLIIAGYVDPFFAERGSPAHYDYTFEIHVPGGLRKDAITPDQWQLPGVTIKPKTGVSAPTLTEEGGQTCITFHVDAKRETALFVFEIA